MHVADEKLMKDAEKMINEEFAAVLNIKPAEVPEFIELNLIKMNKSTLNLGQKLKLFLQRFPNIMSLLQGHIRWQDNINLNKVVRSKCVCPNCINVPHSLVVVPA